MGIFDKRVNLKPYEYPQLYWYVEAIRNSYWIHTEFNFISDIQDFNTEISDSEREVIKRTLLAISQIEISVKTFWADIYKHIPKPEISSVGMSFAESEVRHLDAYSHLLEILWFNDEFEEINSIPCIKDRIDYLDKIKNQDNYVISLLLFSLFVEHISLFSQFLIIMSFNKYRNIFKWISNVVEATSKEENLHWMFWIDLINIIQKEHPDKIYSLEETRDIYKFIEKAYNAENKILDWIFEKWELFFLPKEVITIFLQDRFNRSLTSIWFSKHFSPIESILNTTSWFDDELETTKHWDFFVKRSVNYNKKWKSITEDDLF